MKIILEKIPVDLIREMCEPLKKFGVINDTVLRDMEIYNEYLERSFASKGKFIYDAADLAAKFNLSEVQVKRIIYKYKDLYPARIVKDKTDKVEYSLNKAS